ncbi:lipopolysaccharide biosynthesis protein [Photobacterium damselae]|uniref:lipopolysaccharide biosynthesis protein n=1 Tax=Photobacterium damselae TaxID=38293 RepID=UPI003D7D2697
MKIKTIINYALGPIGAAIISFATLPVMTWFFSQEDVGKYNFYQVYISLSIMVFSLGMHQSYVREYHEVEDKDELIKAALFPGLLFILIFFLCNIITQYSISTYIFGSDSDLINYLIIIAILLSFVINILTHVLRMQERALAFSVSKFIPKLSFFLLILIYIIFNRDSNYYNIVYISVISLFASVVTLSYLIKTEILKAAKSRLNLKLTIKMLKFGAPLIFGGIAYWGLTAIDRVMLQYYSGYNEVALYSVASSIASSLAILTSIFSSIWHPQVYKWTVTGFKKEKIESIVEYLCMLIIIIWCFTGLFSNLINIILPAQYEKVGVLLIGCVSMPLMYLLSEATVIGIGISKKSWYSVLASLISFFVNCLLNIVLIPKFMATGAVISSVLSFLLFFTLRTEFSCYLWISIKRIKVYLNLISITIITIINISIELTPFVKNSLWVFQIILCLFVFHDNFINIKNEFLKFRIKKTA